MQAVDVGRRTGRSNWIILATASAGSIWRDRPTLLFTENETNNQRLYGVGNPSPFVKDGINEAIVNGRIEAVNSNRRGHESRSALFR